MTETADELWRVPSGWSWALFADVARIAQDLAAPNEVMDLPHIAPNHMESGTRRLLSYSTVREDRVISAKQRFFPGQILYSKIRPYLRKAVAVDFVGVCSADVYPISPNDAVDRNYLLFWLASEDFKLIVQPHQGRTLLPKINQVGLSGTPVPVPPLAEQRRIVAKLDVLTARAAAARAELDRVPALAARYKQAVLTAAFRGDLTSDWRANTGSTGKWTQVTLDKVAEVSGGKRLPSGHDYSPSPTPYPYFRVSNFRRGTIVSSDLKYLRHETAVVLDRYRIHSGDLYISIAGTIGAVGSIPENVSGGFLTENAAKIRLSDRLDERFALHFLSSQTAIDQITQKTVATAVAKLALFRIEQIELNLPPIAEQKEIAKRIDIALSEIDRLAAEAAAARRLLDRLDQAILAKAFRGELVPQDPADEPAAALLERIRAERAGQPAQGRRRRTVAAAAG